jgi:mono/diheme cytochrome c family protein
VTAAFSTHAQDGASLFYENCAKCHRDGAQSIQAPVNSLESILTSGTIRQHRFRLTNEELKALITYIEKEKR